jgi:hypothetical protein
VLKSVLDMSTLILGGGYAFFFLDLDLIEFLDWGDWSV